MRIKTACACCMAEAEVPASYVGKNVTCKRCKASFVCERITKKEPQELPSVVLAGGITACLLVGALLPSVFIGTPAEVGGRQQPYVHVKPEPIKQPKPKSKPKTNYEEYGDLIYKAREFVRNSMRFPDDVKFHWDTGVNGRVVTGTVTAKNGFGGEEVIYIAGSIK